MGAGLLRLLRFGQHLATVLLAVVICLSGAGAAAHVPDRVVEYDSAQHEHDVVPDIASIAADASVPSEWRVVGRRAVAVGALGPPVGYVYDLSAALVAPRTTSGLANDVLGLGDDALDGLTASQRRSVRSLQMNIAEHEAKLTAYIDNPDAYDNLGYLANAPSDAVRRSIIQGRVRHFEGEISTFADQVRKLTGGG